MPPYDEVRNCILFIRLFRNLFGCKYKLAIVYSLLLITTLLAPIKSAYITIYLCKIITSQNGGAFTEKRVSFSLFFCQSKTQRSIGTKAHTEPEGYLELGPFQISICFQVSAPNGTPARTKT